MDLFTRDLFDEEPYTDPSSSIRFSVLGSGSCGNSYIFSFAGQSILIDAGYSLKNLKERLSQQSFSFDEIQALFITHLHPDHANGAGVFARKTLKPIYVSKKAFDYAYVEFGRLNIPSSCQNTISENQRISVGPFQLESFPTSHDSAGSVGYKIRCNNKLIVIITDTGVYSKQMIEAAKDADLLFLESNYDAEMLRHGPYPIMLQKRVSGERGHLSNDQARSLLEQSGYLESQKPVFLIHLSDNNNRPSVVAKAMEGFNFTVCERGASYSGNI